MIFVIFFLILMMIYAAVLIVRKVRTRISYWKYKRNINDIKDDEIDYGNTFENNLGKISDSNYKREDLIDKEAFLYEFDFFVKGGISKVNIVDYKGKLLSRHLLRRLEYIYENISILDNEMKDDTNFDKLLKRYINDTVCDIFRMMYDAIEEEYSVNDTLIRQRIIDLTLYRPCLTDEFIGFTEDLEETIKAINYRIKKNTANREIYIDKINYQYESFYGPLLGAKEWVYVISPAEYKFADIYKVGMTTRHPIKRFKELNNTSTYGSFFVHCIVPSNDALYLEQRMHDIYEIKRIHKRREFFNEDLMVLIKSLLDESGERDLLIFV